MYYKLYHIQCGLVNINLVKFAAAVLPGRVSFHKLYMRAALRRSVLSFTAPARPFVVKIESGRDAVYIVIIVSGERVIYFAAVK